MSIDPLTEEYNTWSPYVFSGNRVIEAKELEGLETWYVQDGSQATKAGPYTSSARQQLNLYSPSEVQKMKAERASYTNNKGPMLSQDNLNSSQRKSQENIAKSIPTAVPTEKGDGRSRTEKFGDAAKGLAEAAETGSKAGQISAVIIGIGGAISLQPEVVYGAVELYGISSTVGVVGQISGATASGLEGNYDKAETEFRNMAANFIVGQGIRSLPVIDNVTKATANTAAEAALETLKEE